MKLYTEKNDNSEAAEQKNVVKDISTSTVYGDALRTTILKVKNDTLDSLFEKKLYFLSSYIAYSHNESILEKGAIK